MIKIIAEAGLNWTTFNEAIEYAEQAKCIGADIIKYQVTHVDKTWKLNQSEYANKVNETFGNFDLRSYIKKIEMPDENWRYIKMFCDRIGIDFLATPSSTEKACFFYSIGMRLLKIGSDRSNQNDMQKLFYLFDMILCSNGLYQNDYTNMYCISKYPCDPKLIDFEIIKQDKYIGFSDHTLRFDKEWVDKIKACKNIQYVEKHFKLKEDVIDSRVSLNCEQMKEFINNLRN